MKKVFSLWLVVITASMSFAGSWSLSGGRIYFDNSLTQWQDTSIMLVVGKDDYSSVYEFTQDADGIYCTLPSGWSDATYMAVIGGNNVWGSGSFGYDNCKNATHYSATYTAGLTSASGKWFRFVPQSKDNGCTLKLEYIGDNKPIVTFSTEEKNRCYAMNAKDSTITFIYSTSSKRFNKDRGQIREIWVYGSITEWSQTMEGYRLNHYSDDGCFYETMPFSSIVRVGNSGQPEFIFNVHKSDGGWEQTHHNSSWGENFDKRYLFISNGENMVVAMPDDDINEIYSRCQYAQYVQPLSEWDLTSTADQIRLSNFRRVPGTKNLYRSYHPFDPSRERYDTEERRLHYVDKAAERAGIQCDLALSGDETKNVGKKYTCGGKEYTITIPNYYQNIITNDNVLYVGTKNGHTPDFKYALYRSDTPRFAEWIKEIVEFVLDENHPIPFQTHCAIGADRTGAFSETLAALCDASWEELYHDYECTSEMRIQEYRHRNATRYCIRHLCGVDPAKDPTFNEAVKRHFIEGGYLTAEQIAQFKAKMNAEDTIRYTVTVPVGTPQCYIAASWSNWEPVRMNKIDDTHYTYKADFANATHTYKYLCGTEWTTVEVDKEGKSIENRTYTSQDEVVRWTSVAETVAMPDYEDITISVYSPNAAVRIWWWDGGDRVRNSSVMNYTFSSRPVMNFTPSGTNPHLSADGWYTWTFRDVNIQTGIKYILTVQGKDQSETLQTSSSICYDADYNVTTCQETPTSLSSAQPVQPVKPVKLLKNNHLFLLRDNKLFDITGIVIR